MTGSFRRLLAAFSLIFVASVVLRGQDAAVDRAPVLGPNFSPVRVPVSTSLPPRYPVGRYPVAPYPVPPGANVFQEITRAAGIIFSARVTSIGRAPSSSGQAAASTTLTFQVEQAMRGVSPGVSLTIHEWAGLWISGDRYYVGERVLLFLYAPSKLGLTSPVGGSMGRFAIDSQGRIVLSPQHVAALAADPILAGKTVVSYADFALAVRRSSGEE